MTWKDAFGDVVSSDSLKMATRCQCIPETLAVMLMFLCHNFLYYVLISILEHKHK